MITEVKRRPLLPYLVAAAILFYLGQGLAKLYQLAPAGSVHDVFGLEKLSWTLDNLDLFPWLDLSVTNQSLLTGATFAFVALLLYMRVKHTGTYRYGEEHGSARYATQEEIDGFKDKDEEYNTIFTKHARVGLLNDRLPYANQTNKNVAVVGGPGAGKTFTFLLPNALQFISSKVFTDTKGLLVRQLGWVLEKFGYVIKVVDFITMLNTDQFNPFVYMKDEMDIDRLAERVVEATAKNDNKGEDFWAQAELFFMKALLGYLYFDSKLSNYTPSLAQVTDLLRQLKRKDPDVPSVIELLFEDLEKAAPGNYANKQWAMFQDCFTGETWNSVMAIIASRFSVFSHDAIAKLTDKDTLYIERWNIEKTAVFITVPEVNPAYQFLTALLMGTILDVTVKTADSVLQGTHPTATELLPLEIYGDEWAQMGRIFNLENYMAALRSRLISLKLILQSFAQLDMLYGEKRAEAILDTCDAILYLGANSQRTLKNLSERSGPSTINDRNQSETRSRNGSSSTQHSKLKRELLTPHEMATVPYDEALLFLARTNVYRDKKASINDHPRGSYVANKPTDKHWYRYVRHMSDIDEFLFGVKPSHLVEVTLEEIDQLTKVA
ncbi:VirD4-like conjugal transfer protein, CD1115 family [Streptococcus sp. S784/96/1]|uniref:VirD4-like conjugal transfer protein, CD1115 family n=1 Tax=Streptococcus sp. S784/96/1 TaxID=2653499 RepID=UPI001386CAC7|nr:type IV secretory system conjugative DNA transfer family protein [Streptococcus sp. S784/96/1]